MRVRLRKYGWVIFLVLVIGSGVFVVDMVQRYTTYDTIQRKLETIFNSLHHYAESQEIFLGHDIDVESATSSLDCQATNYFGLFGTNASLDTVKDFYAKEFLAKGWSNGAIDQITFVDFYGIKPQAGPLIPEISTPVFQKAYAEFATLYVVSVRSWLNEDCFNYLPH